MLADEPTGELDAETSAEIIQMMHRLNQDLGTTFIIVTHDPAVARQTDRIIELASGRVARQHNVGSPFEEDWKELRDSALGHALRVGPDEDLKVDGRMLYEDGKLTENGRILRDLLEKKQDNAPDQSPDNEQQGI